jgi:uncharacterized protein YndB with AHSA1/START domain
MSDPAKSNPTTSNPTTCNSTGDATTTITAIDAAGGTRTLVVERVFPHPPQKLWRALTESRLLAQWMMTNDFDPVVGRRFQFRADPMPNWNGIVDCEVLIIEPLQRLSYHWGVGGSGSGLQWVVQWTLTPAEGGTRLRMEQSGFGPDQQSAYQGASYGWQKFFSNLDRVVGGLD